MNQEILAHHTKLFDWFELDKLTKNDFIADTRSKIHYMTPIKANAINSWRTEVNKIYNKKPISASHIKRYHHSAPQEREIEYKKYQRVQSAPAEPKRTQITNSEVIKIDERMNNISLHYNAERNHIPAIEASKITSTVYPLDVSSLDNDLSLDAESVQTEVETEKPEIMSYNPTKPTISMISVSNNLLNYLTVDDCRMAARYKPHHGKVKNNNLKDMTALESDESIKSDESTELPMKLSSGSGFTTLSTLKEKDRVFRALLKKNQLNKKKGAERSDNYQHKFNNIEARYKKFCKENAIRESRTNLEKDHKEGGRMYRKLNAALNNKMNKLVNAKKDKLHEMYC